MEVINMAKNKYIMGKKYLYRWESGQVELIYNGYESGSNWTCDGCHKERWGAHEFVTGDPENPTCIYHFGTECVKKWIFDIEEV